VTATAPRYEKLPPGPGRSPEQVAERQLARLRGAMVEAAASEGYRGVTVRGVCALAGVSTRTFYEHFDGKEACFLDAYRHVMREATERLGRAVEAGGAPRERLRRALEALLREVDAHPAAARVALLEAPVAGASAAAEVRRAELTLASLVGACFAGAVGPPLPPLFARAVVAGISPVLRSRLRAGAHEVPPTLAEELAQWGWACGSDAAEALAGLGRSPRATASDSPPPHGGVEAPIGDERSLLLAATARRAASEGYGALTGPRIRALAGVPRRSFERHFADLDDCFLTACAVLARRALANAARQGAGIRPWAAGVEHTLLVLFAQMRREPAQARLALLDVLEPGVDGLRVRADLVSDASALLLATVPEERRPPAVVAEASVGTVWQLVCDDVAAHRIPRLHRLAPCLTLLLAGPVQGVQADTTAIQANPHDKFPTNRLAVKTHS
jgi:AcrR family transcriptional regulator